MKLRRNAVIGSIGFLVLAGAGLAIWTSIQDADSSMWEALREIGGAVIGGALVGIAILAYEEQLERVREDRDRLLAEERAESDRRLATQQIQFERELDELRADRDSQMVKDQTRSLLLSNLALKDSLNGIILAGQDLQGAIFRRRDMYDADLSHADLTGADLYLCNLDGADASGADFSGASLKWASLIDADLAGANLAGADLSNTTVSFADFRQANIDGVNWQDVAWHHKAPPNWPEDFEPPANRFADEPDLQYPPER